MQSIKVENMTSNNGHKVANQFIIRCHELIFFQSYDSVIAVFDRNKKLITLDGIYWDYSKTTLKYLTQFLRYTTGEAINYKKDIDNKIKSGEYILENLNK